MTTDHEPNTERGSIENRGGFVSNMPDIGCFLDLFLSFPDALFHQLLAAMAHPDRETQIGAHNVFSMVLMPSMVSPWLDQKTKMAMKVQSYSFHIQQDSFSEAEHLNGKLLEGNTVAGVTGDKNAVHPYRGYSFTRALTDGKEDLGSLRLSSHQVSLLLSSIWVQATSVENGPANFEAMAHTFSISLLFTRSKDDEEDDEVPKLVHQFYFLKLWPSLEPDSISQIKKQELTVEKMNRDIREITDKIKEKISEKDYDASGMRSSYYWKMEWRRHVARKGKILSNLYVALDELCFMNNAPRRRSKKEKCFTEEEIDNHNLNSLMRHRSMSLADKKQILRNIITHPRDADKFQSLEVLRNTIKWGYYENHCYKLLREIEQFQDQRKRAAANASAKGKILGYVSMKNSVKDQIK
ncbi:hypothetical protein S83_028955, partial [Arachis hypogaea]